MRLPTWQGWAAISLAILGILSSALLGIHPFLAVTKPAGTGYLVVEGWLHDDGVPTVLSRYDRGNYRGIITTGGEFSRGSLLFDFGSFAELAAQTLTRAGVSSERIQAIPSLPTVRDRTYASAVAVREWLRNERIVIDYVDVVSKGPHARRSRLMFEMALGPDVEIGIIALPPSGYDQDAWWKSSAGVRTVVGETIAYLYAKILFWP